METKVYLIDTYNYDFDTNPTDWSDEQFMNEAESQGTVYSLKGFEDAFNNEQISEINMFIRFITTLPYGDKD
jgi:hypothetical protein